MFLHQIEDDGGTEARNTICFRPDRSRCVDFGGFECLGVLSQGNMVLLVVVLRRSFGAHCYQREREISRSQRFVFRCVNNTTHALVVVT